ncbi:S-layer homology domain-containing protein [Aminipila terrae]|uniref:SLH domain-containing protein n=1 Tax=Aminipila terrae TaxID=2697030 RepID=A0A6P1MBL7_9FIRM|nr:S-layer homology domain-containing protein [Aminipila terrae]QHI72099.1 hypothetical protein Ami3637_06515 [Aminipila terrae]
MTKKVFAFFLAIILVVPLISVPSTVYGATFKDIRGHWAESYINKAVSAGFVKGYPDGTFRPDSPVTRAEFTSMVNKALGNTGTTSVGFSDVPYNEWFYNDVAKGISATFVGGYDDNTFRPNNAVTREEAAAMISRFVPTYGTTGSVSSFNDRNSISNWATDAVARINGKGYMGAYDDGKYHPQDSLTRAMTAKILCSILDKENIVSSSATIKSKGTTLSGRIYSNNVTMDSDLGDGEAELTNCVVLGTLYVYGGGQNTITVTNSRVANAYVEKSSSAVRLLAKGQTTINKTTAGNTATLETSSLSGGLYGVGFNEVDIKGSAKTTLRGSFSKVNVTGSSADVDIESGSINTFNVTSSGRSSDINVDSKSNIGTANVNASVAFKGSGNINTMNANSSGITYETKPKYLKMGSGISSPDYDNSNSDLEITIDPKNKATKVKVNTEITLTFKNSVTQYDGSTIRNSDIPDMVSIRRNSSSGSKVSFSGSINSSKKVITLTPDKDLDDDTKYYVVIPSKEFLYSKNNYNASQTTYFTTGDDSDDIVSFSPKSKATDVSCSVDPTITFSEAVQTYSGSSSSISDSYIEQNIIFKEDSSSGRNVSFRGSINSSNKKITIDPKSSLKEGQKYYLEVPSRKFKTKSDGTSIGSYSVTWTTASPSAPTVSFSPASGASNVPLDSKITLSFSTNIYNTSGSNLDTYYVSSNVTLRDNTSGSNISFSSSIGSSSIVLTPTSGSPLTAGHNYTVSIASSRFKNSSGTYMGSASATFTVLRNIDLSALDTAITNAKNARGDIKISANGSDVFEGIKWVTQDQWNALDKAITDASNARNTVSTTADAQTAANTLNTAVTTFNTSQKTGTKFRINTSALDLAISDAEAVTRSVAISTDGYDVSPSKKWVTQGVLDGLNNAISAAKANKDSISTSSEVSSRADALNKAVETFNAAKLPGYMADKNNLKSAIDTANNALTNIRMKESASEVPVGSKWVTSQEFKNFTDAINSANSVYQAKQASQKDVDDAKSSLEAATSTFNGLLKDGTMPV